MLAFVPIGTQLTPSSGRRSDQMTSPQTAQLVKLVRQSLAQSQLDPLVAKMDAELQRNDLDPVDRGVLLSTKAIALRHSANLDLTAALLAEATGLLEGTPELEALLRTQTAAAGTALAMNRAEDALNYAVDALRLLDHGTISKEAIPPAASNLGHVFREFAAFALAVQLAELAYRTAHEGHSADSLPLAALNLAHAALEGRRLSPDLDSQTRAAWLELAQEACATLIKEGQSTFETQVLGHGTMAEVSIEQGDLGAARGHVDLALAAVGSAGPLLASVVHLAHGMVLRREGHAGAAVDALTMAEDGLRDEYLPLTRLLRERSLAYAELGQYRDAHDDSFLLAHLAESRRATQVGQLALQVLRRAELERTQETLTIETRRLTTLARTDAVTGLASRQWFEAHMLNHEYRTGTIAVLMIDLDRFKSVNDSHGHIAGDDVLGAVGQILAATCQDADIIARFGGDEFIALASDVDEAAAVDLAQRIRYELAEYDWSSIGCDQPVSASIGCAVGPSVGLTDLIASADHRLNQAKASGRNRVVAQTAASI